jgi:CheY-like chemotaxis protein
VVAEDGVEALDYLFGSGMWADRDLKDSPVVVLLDLKLPKISGLEVLRRVRGDGRTKLLPVVVLTTSSEEEDVVKAYELGCNSFIRKPVDSVKLAEALQLTLQYWLVLNERPPAGGK